MTLPTYMIFEIFHENSRYRNGHFQENRENYIHQAIEIGRQPSGRRIPR